MKELTLEITDRCSLNCVHCSTRASPKGKIFFSLDKIEKILEKYRGFEMVRLSGGEPFEHPKIDSICELIHNKGKKVQIMTCGTYFDEPVSTGFLKDIKSSIDKIIFSFNGLENPKTVYHAITAEIPYAFQTVLMKDNYDKLDKIAKDIAIFGVIRRLYSTLDLDIDWHFLRFIKQGRGRINSKHALDETHLKQMPYLIEKLKKSYSNLNITYSNSFNQKKCDCGSKKAVYTIDDREIPCSALKESDKKGKFACEYI